MLSKFEKVHRQIDFGDGQTDLNLKEYIPLLIAAKVAALGVIRDKTQLTFGEVTETRSASWITRNYGCPQCVHDMMDVVFLMTL